MTKEADEQFMTMVPAIKETLSVLLIEDSPDYAALVQQWLATRTDTTFVLNWTDSLQAGLNRLKQGGIDVILLDLGLPDSDGMETFTRAKLEAAGAPVILLSGDNSELLALQMVQDGAQDYIVKGTCNADSLAKAIQYAVVRTSHRAETTGGDPGHATVIGVLGVKGGVGCTTIACNLAVELRRQTAQKTLLADLDLDGGMVSFLLGADSEYTVVDAAAFFNRLDVSIWEGLIARCPGELEVLCSPSSPGVAVPDGDGFAHVLTMMRKLYGWVVLDLGRPAGFSLGLLGELSELFLVTTTSVPALYATKRAIDALRRSGFEAERLRVVVNQISRSQEYSGSDLSRLFGVEIYAKMPAAGKELHDACVQKKLPGMNSDFRVAMASLARKMAGLPPEKPRSRVSRMFSFSDKATSLDNPASSERRL